MAGRIPPRYVPTLTEVVQAPAAAPTPPPGVTAAAPVPAEAQAQAAPSMLSEEQIVHRVMQRIDLTLDRRLREAIGATVLEHTRLLGPLLREEIEAAVRQTVSQALAEELSAGGPPPQDA
jgi:hypothetical protein